MTTTPIYALYVHHARKAAQELAEAGFEAWAPTYQRFRPGAQWRLRDLTSKPRVASRPPSTVETLIYPGYVFARIGPNGFPAALAQPRVIEVLRGAGGMPRPLPEELLGDILVLAMSGKLDEWAPPTPKAPKLVIPLNRARSRKRRKGTTRRLRKWLDEAEQQDIAKAA